MSKLKRAMIVFVSSLLLSAPCSMSAFATEQNVPAKSQAQYEIQPRADVIVRKYRINPTTGDLQYRRWNETQNRWEDPYWIDL